MIKIQDSKFTELLGWYGMLALISGYFLVSFDLAVADSLLYQLLNMTGAIGLVIFALSKQAKQLAILNVFWAAIGAFAIIQLVV